MIVNPYDNNYNAMLGAIGGNVEPLTRAERRTATRDERRRVARLSKYARERKRAGLEAMLRGSPPPGA